MQNPKAILLLSGGLDSTVAAWLLRPEIEPVLAVTVDYGQKAAHRELACAYALAARLGVPHRTVFLPFLGEFAGGALVDREAEIPRPEMSDLDDTQGVARKTADAVWVPNRNGVFIAMAASWAEAKATEHVVCGFNREEAATFPDNSAGFLEATNAALAWSTRSKVTVISPTLNMSKTEIARAGLEAGVPFELCWPCYGGGDIPCRTCESCLRFERALSSAGVPLKPPGI